MAYYRKPGPSPEEMSLEKRKLAELESFTFKDGSTSKTFFIKPERDLFRRWKDIAVDALARGDRRAVNVLMWAYFNSQDHAFTGSKVEARDLERMPHDIAVVFEDSIRIYDRARESMIAGWRAADAKAQQAKAREEAENKREAERAKRRARYEKKKNADHYSADLEPAPAQTGGDPGRDVFGQNNEQWQ